MDASEKWVSLREFARNRGVRLAAVQKAIESGRVMAVRRDGKGHLSGIELHAATAQWNGNTDLDQAARNGKFLSAPASPTELMPGATNTPPSTTALPGGGDNAAGAPLGEQFALDPDAGAVGLTTDAGVAAPVPPVSANDQRAYYDARTRAMDAQANRQELDYLERLGTLVSVDEVREQNFTAFRKLRDNQDVIADRLAPRLAAETDVERCRLMVREEIRKSHYELSRALGVEAAGGTGERAATLQ